MVSDPVRVMNFILCSRGRVYENGLYDVTNGGGTSLDYQVLPGTVTVGAVVQIFAEEWETQKEHTLKLKFCSPGTVLSEKELLKFRLPKESAYRSAAMDISIEARQPGWHLIVLTVDDKYSYQYPVLVRTV